MIGRTLRTIRTYHQVSISRLSNHIDISQSHLSMIEGGSRAVTMLTVEFYSESFGVPLSCIFKIHEHLNGIDVSEDDLKLTQDVIDFVERAKLARKI